MSITEDQEGYSEDQGEAVKKILRISALREIK
jgi:hypothetical protein